MPPINRTFELSEVEAIRDAEGLRFDREYSPLGRDAVAAQTRMIARDGSVWPSRDTGYRHNVDVMPKRFN